jgi:hypothetical protein
MLGFVMIELLKQELVNEAFNKHAVVAPVGNRTSLDECFTIESDSLMFWYNDEGNSTHLLVKDIN